MKIKYFSDIIFVTLFGHYPYLDAIIYNNYSVVRTSIKKYIWPLSTYK